MCVLVFYNRIMLCCVLSPEERVLLQKLLLLHFYCSRLWVRLGELIMSSDDVCWHLQQRTFKSAASEHNRLTDNIVSASNYSAIDCSGTASAAGADGIGCPSLSVDDGPFLQFNIPSAVLQSLTCFVAAS